MYLLLIYLHLTFVPVSDIENLNRGMVSVVRYHIDIVSPESYDDTDFDDKELFACWTHQTHGAGIGDLLEIHKLEFSPKNKNI